MKLILLTNMPAYQQLELARAFVDLVGDANFRLAVLGSLSANRKEMGWVDDQEPDYVLRFDRSESDRRAALEWIRDADVVIQGRFPIKYVKARIKRGGLTYAYQERVWKKGFTARRFISRLPFLWKNYYSVNKSNYHLLAAGKYAASDLVPLGLFKNRAWKFGYFIESKKNAPKKESSSNSSSESPHPVRIVWCGRLIALKRPQRALELLNVFTQHNVDAHLTLVGGGDLEASLKQYACDTGLTDKVDFAGWKSVDEVNAIMANADIMLMSSDHREGWGVVINEAINNACFPMVCEDVGSADWLISNAETGIVYNDPQFIEQASELARRWLESPESITLQANNGFSTLKLHWSTHAAAQRLIDHATALEKGDDPQDLFLFGPCSPA